MRKRLLSILLLCCMVLTLLPTTALAEEAAPAFDLATDLADITIPNDLVTCVCTKANETKQYGQLTNGFSATKVAKEGNVWTVIIYVENSIYKAEFDKDMGCTHAADGNYLSDFTPPIQFKLKYEGGKWVLLGKMPQNKMLMASIAIAIFFCSVISSGYDIGASFNSESVINGTVLPLLFLIK